MRLLFLVLCCGLFMVGCLRNYVGFLNNCFPTLFLLLKMSSSIIFAFLVCVEASRTKAAYRHRQGWKTGERICFELQGKAASTRSYTEVVSVSPEKHDPHCITACTGWHIESFQIICDLSFLLHLRAYHYVYPPQLRTSFSRFFPCVATWRTLLEHVLFLIGHWNGVWGESSYKRE